MKKLIPLLLMVGVYFIGPVCGADEAIEQAVKSYISTMSPDQLARSNAYFEGGYWLQLWNLLLSLLIAGLLMKSGFSVRMRNFATRLSRFNFVRAIIYTIQYLLVTTLLSLPLNIYQEYFREHQYQMSNLTLGGWFGEAGKGLVLGLILMPIFVGIIYAIIRKFRKSWWIWGAGATIGFMAFSMLIAPVFISPMFNDYIPLRQGEVREAVLALARANGVPVNEVYEFNASKQTTKISANVSGLFSTMRVSLNDNLLNRTDLAETRHVVGHEIGHFVLGHVLFHLVCFGIVFVIGFYFVFLCLNVFIEKFRNAFDITSIDDLAALPVLFALFTLFMFIFAPINNTIIRTAEVQADLFALNTAREPDAAAKVAIYLSEYRKMSPGWWEEVIFYDHPSGENRIRAAMTWKAQNLK